MHGADKQVVGSSGSSNSVGAHAVAEKVDEGGVELAAGSVVCREGLASFADFQLLAPLSAEEVQAPGLFGYRGGAMVLARLLEREKIHVGVLFSYLILRISVKKSRYFF